MTRLLGILCNDAKRLAAALRPVRDMLVTRNPVPQWGIGFVQDGDILLSHSPGPRGACLDFHEPLLASRTECALAHAAPPDAARQRTPAQPFRHHRWLFAQEEAGSISDAQRATLSARVPDFLQRSMRTRGLSEFIFFSFLAQLHRRNRLEDSDLQPQVSGELLAEALHQVFQDLASTASGLSLGNLMLSNGRSIIGLRLGPPLFLRRLITELPRGGRDGSFRGVLLVSAPSTALEGFEEVASQHLVRVGRQVDLELAPL